MKKTAIITALALSVSAFSLMAQDQGGPPPGSSGGPPQREGRPGGRGGFHLFPPHVRAQLNLTADQEQQITALEAETKAKLAQILTPQQLQVLKQMRPPRMGPGGPGGEPGIGGGPEGGPRRGGPGGGGPNGGGPGGGPDGGGPNGGGPNGGGPGNGGPGQGGPPPGQDQ
jgi:hypothetical protein